MCETTLANQKERWNTCFLDCWPHLIPVSPTGFAWNKLQRGFGGANQIKSSKSNHAIHIKSYYIVKYCKFRIIADYGLLFVNLSFVGCMIIFLFSFLMWHGAFFLFFDINRNLMVNLIPTAILPTLPSIHTVLPSHHSLVESSIVCRSIGALPKPKDVAPYAAIQRGCDGSVGLMFCTLLHRLTLESQLQVVQRKEFQW